MVATKTPEKIHVLLYDGGGYCLRLGKVTDLIADEMEDLIAILLEKGIIDEEAANSKAIESAINAVKSSLYEVFDDRKAALDRTGEWRKAGRK